MFDALLLSGVEVTCKIYTVHFTTNTTIHTITSEARIAYTTKQLETHFYITSDLEIVENSPNSFLSLFKF